MFYDVRWSMPNGILCTSNCCCKPHGRHTIDLGRPYRWTHVSSLSHVHVEILGLTGEPFHSLQSHNDILLKRFHPLESTPPLHILYGLCPTCPQVWKILSGSNAHNVVEAYTWTHTWSVFQPNQFLLCAHSKEVVASLDLPYRTKTVTESFLGLHWLVLVISHGLGCIGHDLGLGMCHSATRDLSRVVQHYYKPLPVFH
jgi:hypothetical protein